MAWPKPRFVPKLQQRARCRVNGRLLFRGVYVLEAAVALTLLLVTVAAVAKYVAVAQQTRTNQWQRLSQQLAAENVAARFQTAPFEELESLAESIPQEATDSRLAAVVRVAMRRFECQGVPCKEIRVVVTGREQAPGTAPSESQTVQLWRFGVPEATASEAEPEVPQEGISE